MAYETTILKCKCGAILCIETDNEKMKNKSLKEWCRKHKKCQGAEENGR